MNVCFQLGANLILLLTTNALGILSFYLSDRKQRRAFLDTRQSLEMKLVIEEQAKEQVSRAKIEREPNWAFLQFMTPFHSSVPPIQEEA